MIEPLDLHALADGELSAEQASELRRKLETSPEIQKDFDRIVAFKQCLSSRALRHECRTEWQGCVERIRGLEKSRKVEGVVGRYAWALCGVMFLFILGAGISNRGGNQVGSEEVVQAATTLMPTRTPPSADREGMNAYLDALLGEASRSLAPERLQLMAGAVGEVNGQRVARLTLRDPNGEMALIVVSDDLNLNDMPLVGGASNVHAGSADGLNLVAWQVGGASAILVGNRSHEDLAETAQRISIR